MNSTTVRVLRAVLHQSQSTFAANIGVSQALIWQIENDVQRVTPAVEHKIRSYVDVSRTISSLLNDSMNRGDL